MRIPTMELRSIMFLAAFLTLAVISKSTEARHSLERRAADDEYDDSFLGDAASDDETQNDGDIGDEDEDDAVVTAEILTLPTSYNVTIGKAVRLECKVSPENISTVVQWLKDGVPYFLGNTPQKSQPRYSIDKGSKDLIIKDVKPADSGKYTCEILQEPRVAIDHTLFVRESPRIVDFYANKYELREGDELKLTCKVAGLPPPQIVWSKEMPEGNNRLPENYGEYTLNSLTVKNVKRHHSGNYYCYAINGKGKGSSAQANLTIYVLGKPSVHVHKTIVNSALGVEAILQCSVHDESSVNFNWYKDGQLVPENMVQISTNGLHSNLTVVPRDDSYFGTYTCQAVNAYGQHNKSIDLVQRPIVEKLQIDGKKLKWTVHSHQTLEEIEVNLRDTNDGTKWKTVSVPLPDTKHHEYELFYEIDTDEISPGKYEAFVRVRNNISWSNQTDSVLVDTGVGSQYITRASIVGGGAHSIKSTSTVVLSTTLMYLLIRMI